MVLRLSPSPVEKLAPETAATQIQARLRNGRRRGLKIVRAQAHTGSSPALGTNQNT